MVEQSTLNAFRNLFRGRDDVWGSLHGKSNKEPVTDEHCKAHLNGKTSLGIYPLLDNGTCHFAAIDLDERDFVKAKTIRDTLTEIGIPAYITASKSKGFHIYCFAAERFKAVDIRRIMQYVLNKLGLKHEIFPKQDYHQATDTDGQQHPGSYINLPCFGDTRSFLTTDMKRVPLETALERIKRVPQAAIDRILSLLPGEFVNTQLQAAAAPAATGSASRTGKSAGKLPCFEKMMSGVPEGCRDEVAFRLAVHLSRQGMPPQLAEAALLTWDAKFNKPALGTPIINKKIQQAYTGKYGLGCLNDLIQTFCSPDCPVYRKRHTEIDQRKMVGDKELEIMGLTRLGTTPPSFGLAIDGSVLAMSPADLLSLKKVKAKAIETLRYVPFFGMKTSEWEILINSLLKDVKQEDAPPDASAQAHYVGCIYDWLETTPSAERSEDVEAGRPIKKDNGYFFRMKDAVNYLVKHHRINVDPSELFRVVKAAGGGNQTIRLGKLFKLWFLPIHKEEVEEPAPDMEI